MEEISLHPGRNRTPRRAAAAGPCNRRPGPRSGWARACAAVLLPAVLAAPGCATLGGTPWMKRQAANVITPTLQDFHDLALRCDDLTIVKTTLESYLLLVETLVEANPGNRDILVLASMLYAYYGFGFAVDEDLERARRAYWKGIALGKRALEMNRSVKKALDQGEPLYKCVDRLRPGKDVPAAFATAMNQGMLLICSMDLPEAFGEANAFKALSDWVIEHEEGYFCGATRTLVGVYYGLMPAVAGGGAEKARVEFLRAMEICPDFLLHGYLYARYVPTLIDDEALFDELIARTLEADAGADPRYRALNEVAKRKALLLGRNRGLYFY